MDHVKGCSVEKNRFFNPLLNSAIRWARRPVNRRPMKTAWITPLVCVIQFDVIISKRACLSVFGEVLRLYVFAKPPIVNLALQFSGACGII